MSLVSPLVAGVFTRRRRFLSTSLFLFVCVALTGCAADDGMISITGTVTLDGSPVPTGEVIFQAPDGNERSYAGQIKAGKYQMRTTAGKKVVVITGFRPILGKTVNENGYEEVPVEMYIPKKYNDSSELTVEITPDSDATDFELKS